MSRVTIDISIWQVDLLVSMELKSLSSQACSYAGEPHRFSKEDFADLQGKLDEIKRLLDAKAGRLS